MAASATTNLSFVTHRHRTHRSRSYPVAPTANHLDTASSPSDIHDNVGKSTVDRRRSGAEYYAVRPGTHLSNSERNMASHSRRRRDSESDAHRVKESVATVREVRRKRGDSERSPHRHRSRRRESGGHGSTTRVYIESGHSKRRTSEPIIAPSLARRSTHAGESSRTRRSSRDRREPPRRSSERTSTHYKETDRRPLRSERRSVADNVRRYSQDRPPVAR